MGISEHGAKSAEQGSSDKPSPSCEAGQRAELRYQRLVRAIPDLLFRVSRDGIIRDFHAPDSRLLWLAPAEFVGRKLSEIFPKEFAAACMEQIERTLSEGQIQIFEYRGWGERVHELWEARLTICDDDEVLVLTREVTDRKGVDVKLREHERFLSTLLSNIPGYVYRCRNDPNWTAEYVSSGVEPITGYPPEEFTSGRKGLVDLIHEDDRESVWTGVQTAIAQDEPFEFTYRTSTASNEERWVWERGRAVRDASGAVTALEGFITDITAMKRAQEQVLESNERYRVLLRELDHRIRNNLTSIGALVDISSRGATNAQELAKSIRSRVQAMFTAHGLLSRSHHAPLDLLELLKALVPVEFGDRFRFEGPEVLIPTKQTATLGMVVQELVANCIKHGSLRSRKGGVAVSWRWAEPTVSLELIWREVGGEPIRAPERNGLGTTLIEGLVRSEFHGQAKLTYPSDGASHQLVLSLDSTDDDLYRI